MVVFVVDRDFPSGYSYGRPSRALFLMLTNDDFTLPLDQCDRLRREMDEMNIYLVSLIMRNATKAFHREGESNELFECLFSPDVDPIESNRLFFRDSFDDLVNDDLVLEIGHKLCFG